MKEKVQIQFSVVRSNNQLAPYTFHILPVATYMWHPLGRDVLYVGWLIFQFKIIW